MTAHWSLDISHRGAVLCFALKIEALRIIGEMVWQDLQGHITVQLRVASPVHDTHPAFADSRRHLVRTNLCAFCDGHERTRLYQRYARHEELRSFAISMRKVLSPHSRFNLMFWPGMA